jgi:hypothetical protein
MWMLAETIVNGPERSDVLFRAFVISKSERHYIKSGQLQEIENK